MTNPNCTTSLLMLLDQKLFAANNVVRCAYEAALTGEQNLAIGTLIPIQHDLADAETLLRTVFVLHRASRDTAEGGAQ
jgi:hypothetical protein